MTTTSRVETRIRSRIVLVAGEHRVELVSAWTDRDRGESKATRDAAWKWLNDYKALTGTDLQPVAVATEYADTETVVIQRIQNVKPRFVAEYVPHIYQWEKKK